MNVRMDVCTYVCTFVFKYVYMYVCMYVSIVSVQYLSTLIFLLFYEYEVIEPVCSYSEWNIDKYKKIIKLHKDI